MIQISMVFARGLLRFVHDRIRFGEPFADALVVALAQALLFKAGIRLVENHSRGRLTHRQLSLLREYTRAHLPNRITGDELA